MIFSIADHVKQVIGGTKTQTRRSSGRYQVGKLYSIQPKRTAKGISEGKIKIVVKAEEWKREKDLDLGQLIFHWGGKISVEDAKAEGGYTPEEFEGLYEKLHPNWRVRWAYTFKFVPKG